MPKPTFVADIETDGLLDTVSKFHCICAKERATGKMWRWHDHPQVAPRDGSIADGLRLLSEQPMVAGHNFLKYDAPACQKLSNNMHLFPWDKMYDTLLMSQILWADVATRKDVPKVWNKRCPPNLLTNYSLKAWGYRLGILKSDPPESWEGFSAEMLEYCGQDVEVTCALVDAIEEWGYSEQCFREEHEFAWLMFLQEQHGWRFDETKAAVLHATLKERHDELLALCVPLRAPKVITLRTPQFYQIDHPDGTFPRYDTKSALMKDWREFVREPGEKRKDVEDRILPGPPREKHIPFNPTSRPQVIEYLQTTFGWQPSVWSKDKKKKHGVKPKDYPELEADGWHITVDDEVLSKLPYQETKPLAELFMVSKRLGQLADGKQALMRVCVNGRMHGGVNTAGTATGRCSHQRPNVAQVPSARSPYGHEFRELFMAEAGWKMVGFDAAQLELRLFAAYVAYYDGGAYAANLVREGFDAHSYHQQLAGLPTRDDAKTFIYAFLYSAGPGKLGEIIGKGVAAGRRMKSNFLEGFPGLQRLIDCVQERAQRGYLLFPDGRKAYVRSSHSALNVLLQGVGALVMKETTREYVRRVRKAGVKVFGLDCPWWDRRMSLYDFALVANVHDETDATTREKYTELCCTLAAEALLHAGHHYGLRCRLDGDGRIGDNWYDVH